MNHRTQAWIKKQPEEKRRPLTVAVEFLDVVLKKMHCSNIQIEIAEMEAAPETKTESAPRLICGFDSTANNILEKISRYIELINSYQQNQHFVITLSVKILNALIHKHLEDLLTKVANQLPSNSPYQCIRNYRFVYDRNEYHLDAEDYGTLYKNRDLDNSGWQLLLAAGLTVQIDYLVEKKFNHALFAQDCAANASLQASIMHPTDFLKSAADTLLYPPRMHYQPLMSDERYVERKTVEIFYIEITSMNTFVNRCLDFNDFLKEEKIAFYNSLPRLFKLPNDKKHDQKKAEKMLATLKSEEKSNLCMNKERKAKKIKFLEFVFLISRISPAFSLKLCFMCVQNEDIKLSHLAMLGSYSHRMKKLVNEIVGQSKLIEHRRA